MSRRIRNHRVGNSSSKYDFDGGASLERDIAAKAERHYKNCEMIEEAIRQAKATPDEAKSYVVHVLESLYGMEGLRKADQYCDILRARNAALREKIEAAVEDMKQMDRYIANSADPCAALCEVCRHKAEAGEKCKRCDVHDNAGFEWRGEHGTEDKKHE